MRELIFIIWALFAGAGFVMLASGIIAGFFAPGKMRDWLDGAVVIATLVGLFALVSFKL